MIKRYDSLFEATEELSNTPNQYLVIVYTKDSFKEDYDEKSRSYVTNTDWGKWFKPYMGGNSLWGNCLDGKDNNTRLDCYLDTWKVEYCYTITEEEYKSYNLEK